VSFARVSGAILVCGHVGWFVGCGVVDAGAYLFPNHIQALPPAAFYGAAGARVGIEAPILPPRLFLRTLFDLRAPIRPVSYTLGMNNMTTFQTIFQSAAPGLGLGLGLLLELPP
jgi:hypothetical protein